MTHVSTHSTMDGVQQPFLLSSLLPYDSATKKGKQAKPALQEYQMLLTAATQALTSLEQRDFTRFDALVGENFCQMRALKVAMTAPAVLETTPSLKAAIEGATAKTKALSQTSSKSLKELLENEHLDVSLSADQIFLIRSYLLTVTKNVSTPKAGTTGLAKESTQLNNLKQLGTISTNFANALVKGLQKELSATTVTFVRECAATLPNSKALMPLVSGAFVTTHNGRQTLPFFFATDIIMQQARASKIPIVLHTKQVTPDETETEIRHISLLFTHHGKGYQHTITPSQNDLPAPALIFEGIAKRSDNPQRPTEITEQLLDHDVVDLVLMGAADHRQYHDADKESLLAGVTNTQLEHYKTKAKEKGCSITNSSLFFINHAFCASIGSQKSLKRRADVAAELPSALASFPIAINTIMEYEAAS